MITRFCTRECCNSEIRFKREELLHGQWLLHSGWEFRCGMLLCSHCVYEFDRWLQNSAYYSEHAHLEHKLQIESQLRHQHQERLHQALEELGDMVMQFGYRGIKDGRPMIWTGGLSALEGAFKALGWDDPYFLPEKGYTCNIEGCMEEDTAGIHWGGLYLRICRDHFASYLNGDPVPKVKQWALDREALRDPQTGTLPPEARQ